MLYWWFFVLFFLRDQMAKNEIKYLQSVTHPNVIKLFSSEIDDITQKAYMLLDWLPVSVYMRSAQSVTKHTT